MERDVVYAEAVHDAASDRGLDVYRPGGTGAPVVVVLHGSGGDKDDALIRRIGQQLADAGLVAYVLDHALRGAEVDVVVDDGRVVRESYEDLRCALRFVADHAGEHGGDPTKVTLLGQSAGGVVGLVPALAGAELESRLTEFGEAQVRCTAGADVAAIGGLVGFNGAFFVFEFIDVPQTNPELWALVDPRQHLGEGSATFRFILGGQDARTPQQHDDEVIAFAGELAELGHDAEVIEIAEAGHGWVADGPIWDATLAAVLSVTGQR
ncbi:MAG: carboxylesterase family protein [Actinomycetota bacterium]